MPEKKQISKLDWYCPLYADPKLAGKKKRLVEKTQSQCSAAGSLSDYFCGKWTGSL